ncbi:hypothetical protein Agub_g10585, partial [Astrephomene gubernaculifera]
MGWPAPSEPSELPPPAPGPTNDGTIHLSPIAVTLAAAVLSINAIISLKFKLGLHTQLVVASVRMVVQLSLLGYLLVPIFSYDRWWLVLVYGGVMMAVASLEAVQRPSYTFQGMLPNTLLAMAGSSGLLLSYTVLVVLSVRPVWEAQYVIPLLGMIAGNATTAISVGLNAVTEDLAANRAVTEYLLALGANRYEATEEAVRRALKVSMTPLLNQMSVMGVVSIPGMMTGQILAGGDPAQAARYQMVIMFVIGAATCLASVTSVYLAVLHIVDSTHTFRAERLIRKQRAAGAAAMLAAWRAAARRHWAIARRKGTALGNCLAAACCCCLCPPVSPRRTRAGVADGSRRLNPYGTGGSGPATASAWFWPSARASGGGAAAAAGGGSAATPLRAPLLGRSGAVSTAVGTNSGGSSYGYLSHSGGGGGHTLHERLLSAGSATSSVLTAGLDAGLASPQSPRSLGLLGASPPPQTPAAATAAAATMTLQPQPQQLYAGGVRGTGGRGGGEGEENGSGGEAAGGGGGAGVQGGLYDTEEGGTAGLHEQGQGSAAAE